MEDLDPPKSTLEANSKDPEELSGPNQLDFGEVKIQSRIGEFFTELKVLTRKNFILSYRNWKTTIFQLLSPILFLLFLFAIQEGVAPDEDLNPPTKNWKSIIPVCRDKNGDTKNCITLLYSYGDASPIDPNFNNIALEELEVDAIMQRIAASNGLEYSDTGIVDTGVIKFRNETEIREYVLDNPNKTQNAIVFYPTSLQGVPVGYKIYFNETSDDDVFVDAQKDILEALYFNIERELASELANKYQPGISPQINLKRRSFPLKPQAFDVVSTLGGVFFYCSVMFNVILFIYQIVYEKEYKLKQGMKMMGVSDAAYWVSWFLWDLALVIIFTLLLICGGYIFNFGFFVKTNFGVLFFTFFLFSLSMIPLAFVLSLLFPTTKFAVYAGIVIFILGLIFQLIIGLVPLIIVLLYTDDSTAEAFRHIFQFYPPFNFAQIAADIGALSNQDTLENDEKGFSWDDLSRTRVDDLPPPRDALLFQIMCFFVYSVIAVYLILVLPREVGYPPWFFFTKTFWGFGEKKSFEEHEPKILPGKDEDVIEEAKNANSPDAVVKLVNLHKKFRKYPWIDTSSDFVAVHNLSLSIKEGQIFALLGHNGAGKTTTINMLTGLFKPTDGDASVCDLSITNDIRKVQKLIGVCPQHNILWPNLTAREHVDLFAELKGIPKNIRKKMVESRLDDVLLLNVADNKSETFSGGMKRRLSVAIASAGDPKVIYLDEPTTGLDPMSRRHLWASIQNLKYGRVIILTTHSMEEADILGDKIGIMSKGELRCIGTSLHLKDKFGSGYRLNFIVKEGYDVEGAKQMIAQKLPGVFLIAQTGYSIIYALHKTQSSALVPFFEWIEMNKGEQAFPLKSWGVSETTLEEVFLRITGNDN